MPHSPFAPVSIVAALILPTVVQENGYNFRSTESFYIRNSKFIANMCAYFSTTVHQDFWRNSAEIIENMPVH